MRKKWYRRLRFVGEEDVVFVARLRRWGRLGVVFGFGFEFGGGEGDGGAGVRAAVGAGCWFEDLCGGLFACHFAVGDLEIE